MATEAMATVAYLMELLGLSREEASEWTVAIEPRFPHDEGLDEVDQMIVCTRGHRRPAPPAGRAALLHGVSLNVAQRIIREGFRVGTATHYKNGRSVTGMFGMRADDAAEFTTARHHALDKAAVVRSPECQLNGWPMGWSVPVVLCIHPPRDQIVNCSQVGYLWKAAIERVPGSILTLVGYLEVHIDKGQLERYKALEDPQCALRRELRHGTMVICGGRLREPLFWMDDAKNMAPSCGRCFQPEKAYRSKKAKVYLCRACRLRSYTV